MSAKNPKKLFCYVPLGLQTEVRKVAEKHGLRSFSAALRAILRFGLYMMLEADKGNSPHLYEQFIARERGDD